jgi:hypothetical protein
MAPVTDTTKQIGASRTITVTYQNKYQIFKGRWVGEKHEQAALALSCAAACSNVVALRYRRLTNHPASIGKSRIG